MICHFYWLCSDRNPFHTTRITVICFALLNIFGAFNTSEFGSWFSWDLVKVDWNHSQRLWMYVLRIGSEVIKLLLSYDNLAVICEHKYFAITSWLHYLRLHNFFFALFGRIISLSYVCLSCGPFLKEGAQQPLLKRLWAEKEFLTNFTFWGQNQLLYQHINSVKSLFLS